ncbi:hypothetical protein B0H14DRAFT_2641304 [Mycena olivaceomarginata]|nr:hypothetical protein B0H14DRAFT_2641304 [Mycena olivaceomarginata]
MAWVPKKLQIYFECNIFADMTSCVCNIYAQKSNRWLYRLLMSHFYHSKTVLHWVVMVLRLAVNGSETLMTHSSSHTKLKNVLAKHVFKVDGAPIFTAILTLTNQNGEILVCVFVATKSHSQYEEALRRLGDDLPIYGHESPEVFYTDNMSDKPMLEKIFASLRAGVSPVEKYSQLPVFVSPSFVQQPIQLDTRVSIVNVLRSICSEIPNWRDAKSPGLAGGTYQLSSQPRL